LPATDGLFLGETTTPRRWKGNKLLLDAFSSNILPDITKTRNFGSSTKYWASTYLQKLFLSTVAGEGLASHLIPSVDKVRNLGSDAYGFLNAFLRGTDFPQAQVDVKNIESGGTYSQVIISGQPLDTQAYIDFIFWDGLGLNPWRIGHGVQSPSTFEFNCGGVVPLRLNAEGDLTHLRSIYTLDPNQGDCGFYRDILAYRYVQIGKVASLPTAGAGYRGKMIRVEGGSGVADILYMCMKKADDTYGWIQIASG